MVKAVVSMFGTAGTGKRLGKEEALTTGHTAVSQKPASAKEAFASESRPRSPPGAASAKGLARASKAGQGPTACPSPLPRTN